MITITIPVDPSRLGTAQQKMHAVRRGRVLTFANPKVISGMAAVRNLAIAAVRGKADALPKPGEPIRLDAEYRYRIPPSRAKGKNAYKPGSPCISHAMGDADNRHKAVQDALVLAGLFADDCIISDLRITKRWTDGEPCIVVTIGVDAVEDRPPEKG